MKTQSLVLVLFLVALNGPLLAETESGIEVIGKTWEKGIAEVALQSRYPIQSSGSSGETVIKARCEGLVQQVAGADGQLADILQNSTRTIVGFNFTPATEVNQIYVVIKANNELRIFENLSLLLVEQLVPVQQGFTKEDRDYFFLTRVGDNRLFIQFRGQKMLNPPIRPFSFQMEVSPSGELKLLRDSITKL